MVEEDNKKILSCHIRSNLSSCFSPWCFQSWFVISETNPHHIQMLNKTMMFARLRFLYVKLVCVLIVLPQLCVLIVLPQLCVLSVRSQCAVLIVHPYCESFLCVLNGASLVCVLTVRHLLCVLSMRSYCVSICCVLSSASAVCPYFCSYCASLLFALNVLIIKI